MIKMGTRKAKMPDEAGGKVYEYLDHVPNHVMRSLLPLYPKNEKEAESMEPAQAHKLLEVICMKLVVNPKITQEYLDGDDCDYIEMQILGTFIMEDLNINQERILDLKKKVHRL